MPIEKRTAKNIIIQFIIAVVISILGTYAAEKLIYEGYFNLFILVVIIGSIAYMLNKTWNVKALMFICMLVLSFLSIGITGQVLGYAD